MKRQLKASGDPLLATLTIRERPGKMVFRYWQEGPGYDRNLKEPTTILSSVDYFHKIHLAFDRIDQAPQMARLRLELSPPVRVYSFYAHVILYEIQDADVYIYRVSHGAAKWQETFSGKS